MNGYQKLIAKICKEKSINADPRHIEAFMRERHGTLDHLPRSEFVRECEMFTRYSCGMDWDVIFDSYDL